MSEEILFSPLRLGALHLPNRIIMAPLTRMRAGAGHVPTPLNAEYYTQRAAAGLIISEGTAISPQAHGYPNAPGIYSADQIAGWRAITDGVHARGGRIVMQIGHNGRNSHSSLLPNGALPVAPSAIPPTIPAFTPASAGGGSARPGRIRNPGRDRHIPSGGAECDSGRVRRRRVTGREQPPDRGVSGKRHQPAHRRLWRNLGEPGCSRSSTRLPRQLGPSASAFAFPRSDSMAGSTTATPWFVIRELSRRRIGYLHLIEARGSEMGLTDELHEGALNNAALFRSAFEGPLISAAAYTPASAAEAISAKHADAVAFGRLFIANPDLPERIRIGAPLNAFDRSTAYGGGAHGYTGYPTLKAAAKGA